MLLLRQQISKPEHKFWKFENLNEVLNYGNAKQNKPAILVWKSTNLNLFINSYKKWPFYFYSKTTLHI